MDLLPESTSTFWKAGRLQTFQHWPFQSSDNSCNPERMAAAGFLAVGGKDEPDLVECFVCSKQLDGWDPDDDPWAEHRKHQSQCPFVKLGKPNEASWTVHDLFDLFKKYTVKECTHKLDNVKARAKDESARGASEIPQIYKGLRKSNKGSRNNLCRLCNRNRLPMDIGVLSMFSRGKILLLFSFFPSRIYTTSTLHQNNISFIGVSEFVADRKTKISDAFDSLESHQDCSSLILEFLCNRRNLSTILIAAFSFCAVSVKDNR